jgi:uncharacterized membrane protein YgcG
VKNKILVIFALAASINLSSLVIAAHPVFAKDVLSTETVQRTWMPTFKQGQFVYVDPKLSGNPQNPFKFSDPFAEKLNQIGAKHDLKFYVVGSQQGNEPIPANTKVGIAKVDELLSQWSNQPGFDKDRYVIIFWVRRFDNPSKGSVGVNTGAAAREQDVSPELLSDPDGLVIPALKQYMPQNPEGAFLAIANNIDSKVSEHIAQLAQQKVEAAENKARLASLMSALNILGLGALGAGFIWAGTQFVGKRRKKAQVFRQQVESSLKDWQRTTKNGSEIYIELTENHLFFLEKLQSEEIDSDTQALFEGAKRSLARFATRLHAALSVQTSAEASVTQHDYKEASLILKERSIKVSDEALPVKVATLLTGLISEESYEPRQLQKALGDSCIDARDKVVALNDLFERAKGFVASQNLFSQIDNVLVAPSVVYGLAWGERQGGEVSLKLSSREDRISTDAIKSRVQAGENALRVGKLSEAAGIMSEIQQWMDSVREDYNRQTEAKANCDRLSQEVLRQSTQIKPYIESAKQAIAEVVDMYPKISVAHDRQQCDSFLKVLSDFPEHQELIQSNYSAQKYETALRLLKNQNQEFGLMREHLSDIIAKPGQLTKQTKEAQERVESYGQRVSKLRSRSSVSRVDETLDGIRQQILVGDLASSLLALDLVNQDISRAERASRQSSSSSSYSSSGSDYSSSSSGSDYSSSSGGGDYGGSSGGGDY